MSRQGMAPPVATMSPARASGRLAPHGELAQLQSDLRHGLASTVAGFGVYGALLLCIAAFA